MLQRDDMYVYHSGRPSEFEVTFVGQGKQRVIVDGNIIEELDVAVWRRGDGLDYIALKPASESRHIKEINNGRGRYTSDGKPIIATYKGVGRIELYVGANKVFERLGFIFYLYTVPVCLEELTARNVIKPAVVWA